MKEDCLIVKNLSKEYSDFKLADISFHLKSGEILGLIGPNGAGKSTIMKLLLKMIKRDSGEILIDGCEIMRDKKNLYKKNIGYIGETTDYFPKASLKDITHFYRSFYHDWDDSIFQNLIKEYSLNLQKKMHELSKGMKMKFSLALCMSHRPKILILDEPTSGLDPIIRLEVLESIQHLAKYSDTSVLFSSHITEDLERIATNLMFIKNGRQVLDGTKEGIIDKFGSITQVLESNIYKEK